MVELAFSFGQTLIKVIDLGHDGVVFIDAEEMAAEDVAIEAADAEAAVIISLFADIISRLPNLEQIHFCGYYGKISGDYICDAAERLGRRVHAIAIL